MLEQMTHSACWHFGSHATKLSSDHNESNDPPMTTTDVGTSIRHQEPELTTIQPFNKRWKT